jgi:hypothetical protein
MEFDWKMYLLSLSIIPDTMADEKKMMILEMMKLVAMLKRAQMRSTIWRVAGPWIQINRVMPLYLLHLPLEVQVAKACSRT